MDQVKFLSILDRKLDAVDSLADKGIDASEFKIWHSTVKDLIANAFGEKSRQFSEFTRNHHVLMVMRPTSELEDKQAFNEGLERDRAFLLATRESVENYGLPSNAATGQPEPKPRTQHIQQFYLTQSQSQSVKNVIDLEGLAPDVRNKVTELLDELEKKDKKDTNKVTAVIKWLADNAVDVLIALIAAQK